jgi:hypothetical protein
MATTAVPALVLSSGQPVAHQAVRLTPPQLERAQVVPHPSVNPTARAALPGKPVSAPPVRAQSLATASRSLVETRPARGQEPRPAPLVTKNPVPAQPSVRTPLSGPKTHPPSEKASNSPPSASPPRLITRSTPPPPRVPFAEQRRSMFEHPGRPLEPQQLENLRAGRAVGPMLDQEFPPHIAPVPRASPAPRPRPARPGRSR